MTAKRQLISLIILTIIFLIVYAIVSDFTFHYYTHYYFGFPSQEGPMVVQINILPVLIGYFIFVAIWIGFIKRRFKKEKNEN